jgi:hypothetical protein
MKPTRAGQANVELLIEELVLDGLPYDQRHRVATALESELHRLIAEQGLPAGWGGEEARLDGARVQVSAGWSAETMGARAAQAVYGQMVGSGQGDTTGQDGTA